MNEELELIVQRMIDAGESEGNIALVIQEYNKSGLGKQGGAQSVAAPVAPNRSGVSENGLEEESIEQPIALQEDLPESQEQQEFKEKRFFEGEFGAALDVIDAQSLITGGIKLGDFIDDMGRAVSQGLLMGDVADESLSVMASGSKYGDKEIKEMIEVAERLEEFSPSKEMVDFQTTYQNEGGDAFAAVKALAENPSVIPEVMVSSITSMLTSGKSVGAGAGVVGSAAAGGAIFGGVGAVPAAMGSIPYAMGVAGGVLETGLSFSEFLQEELDGKEFNEENVKAVLEDKEKLSRIRRRALTRGATIGVIDALTGKIAGRVGAKLVKGTRASKIKAGVASGSIEAVGGGGGEATARALVGQEMDAAEIGLEAIAEVPMAGIDIISELSSKPKPKYTLNGENISKDEMYEIINDASLDEINEMSFKIDNDPELERFATEELKRKKKKGDIQKVVPNANEQQLDKITELEMELDELSSNESEVAKQRAREKRNQIKSIIEESETKETPVDKKSGENLESDAGLANQKTEQDGIQDETKEPVLEGVQDGRDEETEGQESAELRTEEKEQLAESIGKSRKVKPKNIKGLLDVMGGIFGLNKPQAESAAVVGDVMVETMSKRAGVSKDEMYQRIAFQKAQKAPDGSLRQDAPLIFKSTAKEGLGKIQQKAATPEQWVKQIGEKGGKGTTQELEWIGLQDYLNEWKKENNAKSVPKEVVEQYINDNQIEIVEISKGYKKADESDIKDVSFNSMYWYITLENGAEIPIRDRGYTEPEAKTKALEEYNKDQSIARGDNQTKFSQYTLEGGENYREVLLTLPDKTIDELNAEMFRLNSLPYTEEVGRKRKELEKKILRLRDRGKIQSDYKSSHWDETNILAHLRINERTLPNGERVMFIEEVQSDWAQEGKKKGFKETKNASEVINEIKQQYPPTHRVERIGGENGVVFEVRDANGRFVDSVIRNDVKTNASTQGVPQMPYKKTDQWVGMAMRRAMQMAAQEGFDRVAWVTGEQSADRYDLSKQIDAIDIEPKINDNRYVNLKMPQGQNIVMTVDLNGNISESSSQFNNKNLKDVIGKELAEKVLSTPDNERRTLKGEGLKVGGEGMKAFYNSILPKVASKEAKRFDKKAKVEVVEVGVGKKAKKGDYTIGKNEDGTYNVTETNTGKTVFNGDYNSAVNEKNRLVGTKFSKQLSIAITPEMRMNLNSAVPLFQGEQGAMLAEDGRFIIYALTDPNVSTPLHELAHVYEHYLTDTERKAIEKWSGHKSGTVEFSEKFARGFEKYLADGKAPNTQLQKIFDRFKEWLTDIYNGIKGSEIDLELNKEMRSIYDQMLTDKDSQVSEEVKEDDKPKSSVFNESDGLTTMEYFKQGFEEYTSAMKEKEKGKRDALRESAKAKLAAAKESLNARFKKYKGDVKKARLELKKEVDSMISSKSFSDISKKSLKKINTQLSKANIKNIPNIAKKISNILDFEVRRNRIKKLPDLITKAKKVVDKGRISINQESFNGVLSIEPSFIPDTDLGNALLSDLEALYSDIQRDKDLNPREAEKRAKEIFETYSKIADFNDAAIATYWANKKEGESKSKTINALLEADKITPSQAEVLSNISLKKPTEKSTELSDEQILKRDAKIEQIVAAEINLNPKRRAELINKVGKGFKAPIEAMIDAIRFVNQDELRSLLREMSPKGLEEIRRAMVVALPNNDLTSLKSGLAELEALKKERDLGDSVSKPKARQSRVDLLGLIFMMTGNKSYGIMKRVKQMPLYKIDFFFGLKGRKIFKSFYEPLAVAAANIENHRNELLGVVSESMDAINKKGNKESKMADNRMFFYQLNRLFEANEGRKGVFNPNDVLAAIKSNLVGKNLNRYMKGLKNQMDLFEQKYVKDGEIDFDLIKQDLSKEELEYLSKREKMVGDLESFGRVATSVVRGESFQRLNEYMTQANNLSGKDAAKAELEKAKAVVAGDREFSSRPSAKAGTLKELKANKAQALVPSIFAADKKMVDSVVLDYNMTLPMKSVTKLINNLKAKYTKEGNDNAMDNIKIIEDTIVEALANDLVKSAHLRGELNSSPYMKVLNYVTKKGYQYGLGTPIRALAELSSNMWYVSIADPKAVRTGLKFANIDITSKKNRTEKLIKMARLLDITRATQSQRLLGNEVTSLWAEAGAFDVKVTETGNPLIDNALSKVGAKKAMDAIDRLQENLLQKPDMIAAQIAWFGKFANSFRDITGKSLSLDTFNEDIYQLNKSAFDQATLEADEFLSNAVASNNPYTGTLASVRKPTDGMLIAFNKYLTRFTRFERAVLTQNIDALIKGEEKSGINRKTASANIGASLGRYYIYNAVIAQTVGFMASALFGVEEDDEDEGLFDSIITYASEDGKKQEEAGYRIVRELMSYIFTMGFGNLGNMEKAGYNLLLEYMNMTKGEGITRPKTSKKEIEEWEKKKKKKWDESVSYEGFDHQLVYSVIDPSVVKGKDMRLSDGFFVAGASAGLLKHSYEAMNNYVKAEEFKEKSENPSLSEKERKKYNDYYEARREKLIYRNLPALIGSLTGAPLKDVERISNAKIYNNKEEQKDTIKDVVNEMRNTIKDYNNDGYEYN